jgi:hypothetical protein
LRALRESSDGRAVAEGLEASVVGDAGMGTPVWTAVGVVAGAGASSAWSVMMTEVSTLGRQ